ncbi:hypothetical protein JXA48_00330 [Candidatus Woesearchaeota archaeon]|nr:hypothetical protein [Candidatus Woesearchaeota archaeon]
MTSREEIIKKIRDQLNDSARPLFLFDDDPDGLAAFLLLYKMVRAGKGSALKGSNLNEEYAEKVNEYSPDLVVILDKPIVEQDFFDKVKSKCIWIDHHELQTPKGVTYFNPRKYDSEKNIPTSQLCYEITQEDEWIAAVGIVADWCIPPQDIIKKTREKFGNVISEKIENAPDALYNSDIGKIARVFSFNLKGKAKDVYASMKILSRIKSPQELLNEEHAQAKLVMKQYKNHQKEYEKVLSQIEVNKEDSILLFKYTDSSNSYTVDLSNELLYRYPEKYIIIARYHNNSYRCSLRSNKYPVEPILQDVLKTTGGTGGGHLHACGAIIPEEQFDNFVELIRDKTKAF